MVTIISCVFSCLLKGEKNIATESSNAPSVIYLCRICSSFRTHDESLVENHLIDKHEIRYEMHSDLCSCDDSNNTNRIVLESVLTTDNSIFTAIDNKEDHTSEILNTLYCQTSYLSKSPTNVDDSSPVTNGRNSIDSISPPHSPLSPVLRELNSTRKKITVTLNSSPPPPTEALSISEFQTPEKPTGISGKGDGSTSSVAYGTFLSSSDSPNNTIDSSLKHKCPDCDRCFSNYEAFERHILRSHAPTHHLGEKTVDLDSHLPGGYSTTIIPYEFICSQCDRGFTTNHAYKKILLIFLNIDKKSTRHSDPANTHKCDSLDGNNRKEGVIEPRYRTILPKPCSKQSSIQFSLLDLKPKRRNARRQTSSSSSEQILLSTRQTNHNDDSSNSSIPTTAVGLCNCSSNYISNGNLHIHSNSGNILLQSPASVSTSNNNIIYDSMTATNDSINIPSHLLTVAAAYASQISFNTCNSNDTSQNVSNDSSTPGIQVYPIPWPSDAHSSSLISTESLISDLVVNPSVDNNAVACSSDSQLHTAQTITTTTCDLSFSHESLTSYSYIQLYPVMSSDGTLYYMTGTPVELTQTNNSSHQIDFINQAAACESSYEYITTSEICPSKDGINDSTDSNNNSMNSSISRHLSSTDVDSTMQTNNPNSCTAYIVNNENFNCKGSEETDYFSSHYNGYLSSNDVEVIDLNIPVAVVHLDQNNLSDDSRLTTSSIYEVDSAPNQDFSISYSDSVECNTYATDRVKLSEQQSLIVSCGDSDQNDLNNVNNNNNDNNSVEQSSVVCETESKIEVLSSNSSPVSVNAQVSNESHVSLQATVCNFNDSSQLNNKTGYESIVCLKEYLNFNETTSSDNNTNDKICTFNDFNNSSLTTTTTLDLHNSSSYLND
ncbi:hypothetical protein MN116_005888 [Schistosoma mekongi]|uniref:C2H2-type domain-containing protein n=1 Tax=Schistosoma mekongi TaxID=38744 RepID=A0AAE1ZAT2_SCHME|nr:hypothetical protein MN116_005888 [Schistosoma mekongi]